jgi:hypothetical protein
MAESTFNQNRLKTYLNPIEITEAEIIVAPPASVVDAADKNNDEAVETVARLKAQVASPASAPSASEPIIESNHLLLEKMITVVEIVQSISQTQMALANAVIALVERISKPL